MTHLSVHVGPVHVGLDVAKHHLDVAVLPDGISFRLANEAAGWAALQHRLKNLKVAAIGLEASGGYERGLVRHLLAADLPVRCPRCACAISPRRSACWPRTIAWMPV